MKIVSAIVFTHSHSIWFWTKYKTFSFSFIICVSVWPHNDQLKLVHSLCRFFKKYMNAFTLSHLCTTILHNPKINFMIYEKSHSLFSAFIFSHVIRLLQLIRNSLTKILLRGSKLVQMFQYYNLGFTCCTFF